MLSTSDRLAEMSGITDGDQTPLYGVHASRQMNESPEGDHILDT
jgi:hypothetical protein